MSLMEKRFGAVAVDLGLITRQQLEEGLKLQNEDTATGKPHRLIGSIFLELGYIDADHVAEILLKMVEE
jgi:hypothetical protein